MGGIISGGGTEAARDMERALQRSMDVYQQREAQARADIQRYMDPYYRAGIGAMGDVQTRLAQMRDPQAYYQQLMAGYTTSPEAKLQEQKAIEAANRAAAASGMLGSGAEQKGLAEYTQQLTAADQQRWLENMLGIGGRYLTGEQALMGQGYGAGQFEAGTMSQEEMQTARQLSDLMSQMGQARAYGDISRYGGINQLLGGAAGMLFGGGAQAPWAQSLLRGVGLERY